MLCTEVNNSHRGTILEMYKSNPQQQILMGFGSWCKCERSFILPEWVCIKQKKDGVMMQGPSSFKGALHPFHSTSESPLKWMGYPSVTAGLAGHLSNMRLHKQHFCHWDVAHFPTACSDASFKKLCDGSSQVLTHQNVNIQHGFISHTTLGLTRGQPTKDSWGHRLDSQITIWLSQAVGVVGVGFPAPQRLSFEEEEDYSEMNLLPWGVWMIIWWISLARPLSGAFQTQREHPRSPELANLGNIQSDSFPENRLICIVLESQINSLLPLFPWI